MTYSKEQLDLINFLEWLDSEGLMVPEKDTEDKRPHDKVAEEYIVWRDVENSAASAMNIGGKRIDRPHSRACGYLVHPHGTQCSKNCPTCHGK